MAEDPRWRAVRGILAAQLQALQREQSSEQIVLGVGTLFATLCHLAEVDAHEALDIALEINAEALALLDAELRTGTIASPGGEG